MANVVEIVVRAIPQTTAGFATAAKEGAAGGKKAGDAFKGAVNKAMTAGTVAFIGISGAALKMAGDFQAGITTLVTGAGEAESNIKLVSNGVKRLAVETGNSTKQLIDGLYMIESAGFHGAEGLKVLRASAQGAKVGNADLGTVANAVTTILNAYGLGADKANAATNAMVATVAAGKVHMEDLGRSISRVLPTAAALKIPISEVGGAMATMTGQGISAKLAAMGLNSTMLALAAPSGIAAKAMDNVGLSSKKVADTLTKQGLVAALQMVTEAAGKKFKPGSDEYVAALNSMLGGSRGLQVALALTGKHLDTLKKNTQSVGKAMGEAGDNVQGWDKVQKEFNFKLDKFKATAEVAAINLGQKLLPAFQSLLGFLSKNADVIAPLVLGLTALLTVGKVVTIIYDMAKAFKALGIAMSANAFGVIVLAIAAIGTAFYIAWQKSAGFRDAIKKIAVVFLEFVQIWLKGAKFVLDTWMSVVGGIIHGAAVAFGWVPGLGGKLRDADKAFQGLRKGVDKAFDGMIGKVEEWQRKLSDSTNQNEKAGERIKKTFDNAREAANKARIDVNKYSDSIRINGVTSDDAKAKRQKLIDDMIKSGVNATIARRDVDRYTDAVKKNGWDSEAAHRARQRLIDDIFQAFKNSQRGRLDMDRYTDAVRNNGARSDAAKSARARLIDDLKHSGLTGKEAARLVDGLTRSIKNVPASKTAHLRVDGKGYYSVAMTSSTNPYPGGISGRGARGMRVPGGWGGGDSKLILAEPGELLLPKEASRDPDAAMIARRYGVPGYARGGIVGSYAGSVPGLGQWTTDNYNATVQMSIMKTVGIIKDAVNQALAAFSAPGVGGAVARWAGVVQQALAMVGLSQALVPRVLYQISTESGGNQYAINLWDLNAILGNPSKGLLQVTPGTFGAFHWPGTSWDIYNPLANIAAAIHYASHVYGPTLMRGGMGIGSGHGYGSGGIGGGWGVAGEFGRELIRLPYGSHVYPHTQSGVGGGGQINVTFEVESGGGSAFDQFMAKWIREFVKIRYGGNVQAAFGAR